MGAVCAYKIAQTIPRKLGLMLFGMIGAIAFIFPNREKSRTIQHLKLIFGNSWSESEILKTARNVYIELGKNLFDGIHLPGLPKDKLGKVIKYDSFDDFRDAYNKGKGVIAISAHIGCFEMLPHYYAYKGFRSFSIGRRLYDERLELLIRRIRNGESTEYLDRSERPRNFIRKLQEGKVFGVLIDQDTRVEGVYADFLGKKAYTPSGAIKMAMKLKIPVFVVTTARNPDNTHTVYIGKRLPLIDTGDFESDLIQNVQIANNKICETILKFPSQWVWMHRRWKRQPVND